ncbi:MAG: DUF4915 domain-containing protein [Deltaproteobacteria bacterium]|nr:DUF4915 domain-containing protein [Deltaproteobacteria bacterium]
MFSIFDKQDWLLVSCCNDGGLLLLNIKSGSTEILDNRGCTGLIIGKNYLLRGLQYPDLFAIERVQLDGAVTYWRQGGLANIHDLIEHKNLIYAVSTATNEVVCLNREYQILKRYRFPGEGESWHLNCLDVWQGRIVVSAFGKFSNHLEFKGQTVGRGLIVDLESQAVIVDRLSQPHSILTHGGCHYCCNSEKSELVELRNGEVIRSKIFEDYVRGLCVVKGKLLVGLSKSRNIETYGDHARIIELDLKSFSVLRAWELPFPEVWTMKVITLNYKNGLKLAFEAAEKQGAAA